MMAKFGLSSFEAKRFVAAVKKAEKGDLAGFANLIKTGISEEDMKLITSGQMPSADAIRPLSKTLKSSQSATKSLMAEILGQIKEQI
jgi:hypothetical protein